MSTVPNRGNQATVRSRPRLNRQVTEQTLTSRLSREEYAMQIRCAWQKTIEGIIDCGTYLNEARAALGHGDYEAMIASDLPFTTATARKLRKIAANPVLANRAHVHALPAHWGT